MSAEHNNTPFTPACPLPPTNSDRILLAHGGGGTLMHRLIDEVFLNAFNSAPASDQHDSTVIQSTAQRLAFTTDSFVVRPLFFPGGDIGSLAVHGTVNDLAMSGATPAYLSAAYILEEGFPIADLNRIVRSMAAAAREANVRIITGDTKVVDKGKGDGLYINTAGIGLVNHNLNIIAASVRPGDAVIISGDIGRHGIAIMAKREGLQFESTIESDSAPVHHLVQTLLDNDIEIHCMRDLTRGGLASALNEIASQSGTARPDPGCSGRPDPSCSGRPDPSCSGRPPSRPSSNDQQTCSSRPLVRDSHLQPAPAGIPSGSSPDAHNPSRIATNIELIETNIPIRQDVAAACEILGLDPLHVACEGRFITFVPESQAQKTVQLLQNHPDAKNAAIIATVKTAPNPAVTMKTNLGTTRIIDMLSGEQLPRIC